MPQYFLKRDQNYALQIETGQYADTPVAALSLKSGISQYTTIMDRNCVKARERRGCVVCPNTQDSSFSPMKPKADSQT